jgi:alkylation response protein AidB-like acyl-CoA dehydrogenase
MNFEFTQEEKNFRKEVEDFVRQEMPSDWDDKALYWPGGYGTLAIFESEFKDFVDQFRAKLGRRGWLTINWPRESGGMGSVMKHGIFIDVLSYHRLPYDDVSSSIGGPTIAHVGSEELKKEWLPRISRGEVRFWLGYSEPNSGSDLGSLQTKAEEDGDDYIINGQKIWSSGAHIADYGWMMVRTDPKTKNHEGLTLMIVDNNIPGITIRPLENIAGIHSFNEVFFDNVRVPKKNVVGQINKGFYHLMYALQHERIVISVGAFRRVFDELLKYVKETSFNGENLGKNARVRDGLAEIAIDIDVLFGYYWRIASAMDRGLNPSIEASALKLFSTELSQKIANISMDILGPYGQVERGSKWAQLKGRIAIGYMDSVSGPIGAGTSEIQRSLIATRGLGLPRK